VLNVTLVGIEVKSGSNWTTNSQLLHLEFRPPGKPLSQSLLDSHDAGYATIRLSGLPTGGVWRARVSVDERLTGLAATSAHLENYSRLVKLRLKTGNTNIPVNPFATNLSFFRHVADVLTQDISAE
jgi:hypothetical protein